MRVSIFTVADQKKALQELAGLVEKSTVDPLVRNGALALTSDCDSRDDECEVHAIFNAVKTGDDRVKGLEKGLKYMSDPRWADFFSSPGRTLRQLGAGYNGGDCLPADTLLLGAGYKPFPIGEAKVGDLVMGDGKWAPITNVWDKEVQGIRELKLVGGGTLRCTDKHRVFKMASATSGRSEAEEVLAEDIRIGDYLLLGSLDADHSTEFSRKFGWASHKGQNAVEVGGIVRAAPCPTFDIEVEGHRFYLPETDLIVHNCDDHSALICGLLGSLGFVTGLRAWGRKKDEFDHVYAMVALPKLNPSGIAGLDTTVEESEPGWEPPKGYILTAWMDGR